MYGASMDKPSAYWPVGTPALYALLYWIFGFHYLPIAFFNVLLVIVIITCTVRLARRSLATWPTVDTVAGMMLAVWPTLIMYVTILASELAFMAAMLLAIDLWTNKDRTIWIRGLGAGVFLAVACYVRPPALLLPIVLFICQLAVREPVRRCIAVLVIAVSTMIVLISPWTIRNYRVLGEPVLISSNGGSNLWIGNHPGADGEYTGLPERVSGLSEVEASRVLGAEAREFILSDIPGFVRRTLTRVFVTYRKETVGVVWNQRGIESTFGSEALPPLKVISSGYWLLMLALAFAGVMLAVYRQRSAFKVATNPLLLSTAYVAAVHAVFMGSDRFHLASIPAVSVFAAIAVSSCLGLFVRQQ